DGVHPENLNTSSHDHVRHKKLTEILTHAVKYIAKAQSSQGGWYHTSKMEGHDLDMISVTAIQLQALQACENAGIPVPRETIKDGQEYLKMALGKFEKVVPAAQNHSRQGDIAAAVACIYFPNRFIERQGGNTHRDLIKNWYKLYYTDIP